MTDTERLAFEKWMSEEYSELELDFARHKDGYYYVLLLRRHWKLWQARSQDSRCVELLEAAKIFGALLQPLHDEHKDHHPIYGINSVTITAGDLRRLTKAIAAFEVKDETI